MPLDLASSAPARDRSLADMANVADATVERRAEEAAAAQASALKTAIPIGFDVKCPVPSDAAGSEAAAAVVRFECFSFTPLTLQ